jgi:hypothetical protein
MDVLDAHQRKMMATKKIELNSEMMQSTEKLQGEQFG